MDRYPCMCTEPWDFPTEAPTAPSSEEKPRKGQSALQVPENPGSALHYWVLTHKKSPKNQKQNLFSEFQQNSFPLTSG